MVFIFIMKSSHPLLMFRLITNKYFFFNILSVRLKKNFGNKPFPSYSKIQMVGDLLLLFFCRTADIANFKENFSIYSSFLKTLKTAY